jgi:mono/diheme cytochrome c family protein
MIRFAVLTTMLLNRNEQQRCNSARIAMTNKANFLSVFFICTLFLFAASLCAFSQNSQRAHDQGVANKTNSASASLVTRGKYIVEGLSRCGQCHTPRDANGNSDRSHLLEGAPVWLKSAEPVEDWPLQAPRIAGIPPGSDADMIKLLTTGIWRDGKPLRQPMPQFRMTEADAEAVVAYLKTLQ